MSEYILCEFSEFRRHFANRHPLGNTWIAIQELEFSATKVASGQVCFYPIFPHAAKDGTAVSEQGL